MKKTILSLMLIYVCTTSILSQLSILTVAEKTNYESTSRYQDVMDFVDHLKKKSKFIRTETIAISEEGREIPLMVIANPMPKSPKELANDSRIVVYLQGNIHAGEVEGKEALLMFARDLLAQKKPAILKDVILLIGPIFNADGNERISVNNRARQNGPKNGVGVRHNALFLDLNRDALKAESSEIKGLISNVLNRWDPAIVFDSHTTNGVYRQEPVTNTWQMNPNGDLNLRNYMRDKLMPALQKELREIHGVENCFYGEFNDLGKLDRGYAMDAHEPRYLTNYVGLRNRLAILNENYVYADFKARVEGTYATVQTLLDYVLAHKSEIKNLIKQADHKMLNIWDGQFAADSFSFDYGVEPIPYPITLKIFEVEPDTSVQNYLRYKPTNRKKTVELPYLADYVPNKRVAFPYAYLLTIADKSIISNLKTHGIKLEKLKAKQTLTAQKFEISNLKGSARLNQGHYTNTVEGGYVEQTIEFEQGTYVIKTSQALANVLVYLLEPQSGDGYLFWNFFDRYIVPQWGRGYFPYPVYRINHKIELRTEPVNQ
jgi:hypothetical protein